MQELKIFRHIGLIWSFARLASAKDDNEPR